MKQKNTKICTACLTREKENLAFELGLKLLQLKVNFICLLVR